MQETCACIIALKIFRTTGAKAGLTCPAAGQLITNTTRDRLSTVFLGYNKLYIIRIKNNQKENIFVTKRKYIYNRDGGESLQPSYCHLTSVFQ